MRILHTSDWHIGRTFHGHSTAGAAREVLLALAAQVRKLRVDVVVVAGDVFDSATPPGWAFDLLTEVLQNIRAGGARVVLSSGNHDSPARLGFQAQFLGTAGVHVATDPAAIGSPITLDDDRGPVHFYALPYLEPSIVRTQLPGAVAGDAEPLRTQEDAIRRAMVVVNDDHASRGGRSVVVAHCFTAGVEATPGVEREIRRDLRQGTLDVVPVSDFGGHDYVALGHIHSRATLAPAIRYSGAPLHFSFGEQDKPRGAWLVKLDGTGSATIEWIDLPIPRPLVTLHGELADLLDDPAFDDYREHWVCAVLTDQAAPTDPMRRLRDRFPWCATVEWRPAGGEHRSQASFRERLAAAASDDAIIAGFLDHVRNGVGPNDAERALITDVIAAREGEAVG